MRVRLIDDRGSVLLLGIGLIGVILLAISVVTDASMAFLQRQALQARADAAVLAGVQQIDLDQYYSHGATESTQLVPIAARDRARDRVHRDQESDPIPGLTVDLLHGTANGVEAQLSAPVRTAFWPIAGTIRVRAAASLDYVG